MKFPLLAALAALTLTGCNVVTGTRKAPDGTVLTLTSTRLFWASEGVNFGLQETNGVNVNLAISKSAPDSASIQAVAQGVAAGLANGAVSAAKP